MITVNVSIDRDKREFSLSVKGHAGYAEEGKDIVCASASILAYTIAQVIKNMGDNGDLTEPPTLELNGGDANIVCRAKNDDLYADLVADFYVIKIGYMLLAHNYPQYVEIIDGEA